MLTLSITSCKVGGLNSDRRITLCIFLFTTALKTVKNTENIVRKPVCIVFKIKCSTFNFECDIYQPAPGSRGGL